MPEANGGPPAATSNNMRAAVIVGLGGTGLEVITMVKRMIVERYGALDQLPIVSFLHADTASEDSKLTPTRVLGQDIGLTQRERITLKMPTISDGGAAYLASRNEIREWFPPSLRIDHDFALGAGAVRSYGRIALAENAQQFEVTLRECIKRVNDDDRRRYVAKQWGAEVDAGIDVYLVCSLLGGTGSGTFLDAAYLARHVVKTFHDNTQVLGFLIIGGGSSIDSNNLANCYSALKELSYYSTVALRYNETQRSGFDVQYPRLDQRLESKGEPPFTFCYLATNFNEQHTQFRKEELFELTAQNIFLEFTPGVAASKRGIRNNIAAHGYSELDGQLGQAQSFLSFGISTIEFPALRVQDCLAYRLAGEALNYFNFNHAPVDSLLTAQVKQDLHDWGLDFERLIKALLSDNAGLTLLQQTADFKGKQQGELQKYLPRHQRDHLQTYLGNYRQSIRDGVQVAQDPAARGAYIKQIEMKAQQLLETTVNQLRRRVAEKVSNPHVGVKNTRTYLEVLGNELKTLAKNCQLGEEQHQRKAAALAERDTKVFARVGRERHEANDGEMRTLVNDALSATLELSQTTLLEYAHRRARLLLAGEQDAEGRWVGESLRKEIERLGAQLDDFCTRLNAYTLEFVGQRERDTSGREAWNGGKYAELRNNLTGGAYNSDVLVDPDELDALYQECIAVPAEAYNQLKDVIEQRLGADGAPRSIFWCVLEQPEQTRNLCVEASRARFLEVRNKSIAKKLAALPQADVERRLQEAAKRSHVLLRFDNTALFAFDANGKRLTSHNPGYHAPALLATCHPQDDPEVNLKPAAGQEKSRLAQAFSTQIADLEPEPSLPDRYRLVFVREKGVFPLYCIAELAQLRASYVTQTRQHNAKPRETDQRIEFPDLFPLDPRIKSMPARVQNALTLGRIFELVRADRDVQTEEPAIIYAYRDENFRLNESTLGRNWEEAAAALAERQINKEVYRERAASETTLEHLEKLLALEGRRPATVTEREAGWVRLQHYLLNREQELPGGERAPQYQREAQAVGEFCKQYGWAGPTGWSKPAPAAEPVMPPAAPTQKINTAGAPTQIIAATTDEDETSFRQRVAIKLRRSPGGQLPLEAIAKLMQEGTEEYGLSDSTAKQIIDEAQRPPANGSEPDALSAKKYRELCCEILESGASFEDDRQTLADKQRRLNLTLAQAQAIEQQVAREQSHAYLREVK